MKPLAYRIQSFPLKNSLIRAGFEESRELQSAGDVDVRMKGRGETARVKILVGPLTMTRRKSQIKVTAPAQAVAK